MKEANKKLTSGSKESTVVFYEGVCPTCHAPAVVEQRNGLVPKFCRICGSAMDYSPVSSKKNPASLKVEGKPQRDLEKRVEKLESMREPVIKAPSDIIWFLLLLFTFLQNRI